MLEEVIEVIEVIEEVLEVLQKAQEDSLGGFMVNKEVQGGLVLSLKRLQ